MPFDSGNHGYPRLSSLSRYQRLLLWLCVKLTPSQMADVYSLYLREMLRRKSS